jgi:hypothetical protein
MNGGIVQPPTAIFRVVARESDFINTFLLVHLSLEPGEVVDLGGIERGQSGCDRRK